MSVIIEYEVGEDVKAILNSILSKEQSNTIIMSGMGGMYKVLNDATKSGFTNINDSEKEIYHIIDYPNTSFILNPAQDVSPESEENFYINGFRKSSYCYYITNEEGKLLAEILCTGKIENE